MPSRHSVQEVADTLPLCISRRDDCSLGGVLVEGAFGKESECRSIGAPEGFDLCQVEWILINDLNLHNRCEVVQ